MARLNVADIVATVEKYLVDNWPDSSIAIGLTARDATASFVGTEPTRWTAMEWPSLILDITRGNAQWAHFELEVHCFSRFNDPLDATRMADNFSAALHGVTRNLVSRSDGTTVVGVMQINDVIGGAPTLDARGIRTSVCRAKGWARTP